MAEPTSKNDEAPPHKPYVPDEVRMPEFTWSAVALGAILGIVFGASSLYLLLKVGMTVSASVPIAVLSITLFRSFSKWFGIRRATILENNIVQTTGSAGESIAFGVGVTMPALLLLGFEMEPIRVMTVSVLGGLLGILMMIPLRRAFIVKQHGKLIYPEGTACAEVLVAGEKGGATARMVFIGFAIAAAHKFLTAASKLWASEPTQKLYTETAGTKYGLKGAEVSGELSPELLGVGYLIGPRVASLMIAGAILSYFVVGPTIATIGETLNRPVPPAVSQWMIHSDDKVSTEEKNILVSDFSQDPRAAWRVASFVGQIGTANGMGTFQGLPMLYTRVEDKGLIRNMEPGDLKNNYLKNIGAGAVAAGGIISMLRSLPLIISSIVSGLRDLRASRAVGHEVVMRTERDMRMTLVLFGSLALVLVMMFVPSLGLGISPGGFLGALMILLFGFLFVTVSSRLTGEIGSSSNPISGMTIATLLMTCLIFLLLGKTDRSDMLTALTVAAVVCIASSNGGTTSQDLKTGYLVGATPRLQQWAIVMGALTSAVVIGVTMLALNAAGSHYTTQDLPSQVLFVPHDAPQERPGKPYGKDTNEYRIVHVRENDPLNKGVKAGRYLVDEQSRAKYRTDMPMNRQAKKMDNGLDAPKAITAPQPDLFTRLIEGILGGTLQWSLVALGVLVAIVLELAGVSALPFAVGMYLPLSSSTPIFVGGLVRWLSDRIRGVSSSEADTETSPGVLLSSGYIAGGTLCGLAVLFFSFLPDKFNEMLDIGRHFGEAWNDASVAKVLASGTFALMAAILLWVGTRQTSLLRENGGEPPSRA